MLSAKPSDFSLLLEVFRDGLRYGVVSKEEVIAWADEIINQEEEPDYFFIELSMQSDINGIISAMPPGLAEDNRLVSARALLGLTNQKLAKKLISPIQLFHILYGMTYPVKFDGLERMVLYQVDEDHEYLHYSVRGPDYTAWVQNVLGFLEHYKEFRINNSNQWPEINARFEAALQTKKMETEEMYRPDPRGC